MKPTISLQLIVKDEVKEVETMIGNALGHFDAINITVSDLNTANELKNFTRGIDKVYVKFRKWNDNFADARNANLEMCDTDYFFWLDADDIFGFLNIPTLLNIAVQENYEAIYLPYNYAQDNLGNTVTEHYRERLIKNGCGFEWRGSVHENLMKDSTFMATRLEHPVVVHNAINPEASKLRNHKILLKQVEGVEHPDPRDLHYLGISYFAMGEYQKAINTLYEYTKVGGWDEEIYRSLIKMSEAYFMLDDIQDATDFAMQGAAMLPHYPDAYFTLARYEYAMENWLHCLQWLEVALSKPKPQTMSIQNPQVYEIAKVQAATCYFSLGQFTKAYKYLQTAPEYLKADIEDTFKLEANKETFAFIANQLVDSNFVQPDTFFKSISRDMQFDPRMSKLRNRVITPSKAIEKSIVFYCGAGYEEWGAHTLSKGMGGSEEAVVYLSRELVKRGYKVTVYGAVTKQHLDQFDPSQHNWVEYLPYQEFDARDEFDTLVLWRAPGLGKRLKARVKIIDMHDILPPSAVLERADATYFVKSQWQRNLYPDLPDEQFHVIGNGIVTAQFKGKEIAKRPHSVGYFSSYYRGLETLIDLWPKIRAEVPDATLDFAYGWGSYTAFQGEDAFYKRMNAKIEAVKDQGVTCHDRLSHDDLAELMLSTQVWGYPTEFPETHCITALKAQEALCYPVTTTVAALNETVQCGLKIDTAIMYSNEYEQAKFVREVVAGMNEEKIGKPVPNADWSNVADNWINFIEGKK